MGRGIIDLAARAQLAAFDGQPNQLCDHTLFHAISGRLQVFRGQRPDPGHKVAGDAPAHLGHPVKQGAERGGGNRQNHHIAARDHGKRTVAFVQRGKLAEIGPCDKARKDDRAPVGCPIQRQQRTRQQEMDIAAAVFLIENNLPSGVR